MPSPDPICSDNCGTVDVVPTFIRTWFYVPAPFYSEYWSGKDFEYFGTEPDGRCVWFPIVPSSFWNFEKISRYPEGGNFPFFNPIPGKWSWRLSVDRFPFSGLPPIAPPYILNGWQGNFTQYQGVPDPSHNCTALNTLTDYAHFGIFPPAFIQPLSEEAPPIRFRSSSSPCFCSTDCPFESRPHRNYLVFLEDPNAPLEYLNGLLFRFTSAPSGVCFWDPPPPDEPPGTQRLEKRPIVNPAWNHSYEMVLTIQLDSGFADQYQREYNWNNSTDQQSITADCAQVFHLIAAGVPVNDGFCVPVPEYICDTAQARAWWASHSTMSQAFLTPQQKARRKTLTAQLTADREEIAALEMEKRR